MLNLSAVPKGSQAVTHTSPNPSAPPAQGGFSTAGSGDPLKIRPVDEGGEYTSKFKRLPKAHNVYFRATSGQIIHCE